MNTGKYVFAQLMALLSPHDFDGFVKKYKGNHGIKHFSCWHQLMCMLFGQLCSRESLSDLMICLRSPKAKWYHLGMGTGISKSNLAYANEQRDWRMFAGFAFGLIVRARKLCSDSLAFEVHVQGKVYAVDATTMDLCLSVFWWAKWRTTKAAVRLHTQLDLKTDLPSFVHITDGSVHEVNILDELSYESGAFYILDRGYLDCRRLFQLHKAGAFFVTRIKTNMSFRRLYSAEADRISGVKCDQTIKLTGREAAREYPEKLRRIKYRDGETAHELQFLTNNFELKALDIALLYKYRWKIELFFKWIKQHLKIKSFWGQSENAGRIQIYTAIIAYTLVVMVKHQLRLEPTAYEILQILSLTLLSKTQLNQLFDNTDLQNGQEPAPNQLILF